jgi:biopolymer transport protein ExbD
MDDLSTDQNLSMGASINGLIPLIDVLLVVLTFMMGLAVMPSSQPTGSRPKPSSQVVDPRSPLQVVALTIDGDWLLNGQPISEQLLLGNLGLDNRKQHPPRVLFLPSDGQPVDVVSNYFSKLKAVAGDRVKLRMPSEQDTP